MKIKVNKHKLNIHYRGSPWGSRTQHHAYCLRYAHSQHIESHLGKKQPQAKIAIAFLFGQLHFSNVTSHALVYGGHLVMRSKRCAVQNHGITLITWFLRFALKGLMNHDVCVIEPAIDPASTDRVCIVIWKCPSEVYSTHTGSYAILYPC